MELVSTKTVPGCDHCTLASGPVARRASVELGGGEAHGSRPHFNDAAVEGIIQAQLG